MSVGMARTGNDDEDGSQSVTVGDTLHYSITATNTGKVQLTNVVVSDTLDPDTTPCATLAVGATCVLDTTYVVTHADVDAGSVINTGTAASDQTGPETDQETVQLTQSPALSVVKIRTGNDDEDGSQSVTVGDTLHYSITATNTGNVQLTNVVVSDTLDPDTTTCATLAVGATCVLDTTYVVTQADVQAGSVVNTGTADSDQTGPETDQETVKITQSP